MSIHSYDDENNTRETVPFAPEDSRPERPYIEGMSDREMLVEILTNMRSVQDAVSELEKSPMIAALKSGQNPLMAMMGR